MVSCSWMIWSCSGAGVNAASVAEATLMTLLMLARRAKEQMAVFQQKGLGEPFGIQLAGKRLGIVGMGNIGDHPGPLPQVLHISKNTDKVGKYIHNLLLNMTGDSRHASACLFNA